jgi:hypothetical protein
MVVSLLVKGESLWERSTWSPLGYLEIRLTPLFASFLEWEKGSAGKGQSSDPEEERLAWPIGDPMVIRLINFYSPPSPPLLSEGEKGGGARFTWSLKIRKGEKISLIIKWPTQYSKLQYSSCFAWGQSMWRGLMQMQQEESGRNTNRIFLKEVLCDGKPSIQTF